MNLVIKEDVNFEDILASDFGTQYPMNRPVKARVGGMQATGLSVAKNSEEA